MTLEFTKMNGAGNDFVMIYDFDGRIKLSPETIRRICDRRRGVGADGLILVQSDLDLDFHMRYHNADGYPAEMCGNGSRCAASFAAANGLGRKDGDVVNLRFSTDSGPISAVVEANYVTMVMMDAREMRREIAVRVAREEKNVHFMIVGTRHVLVLVDDVNDLTGDDIKNLGSQIRHDAAFGPIGANVNFVSIDDNNKIYLRTYEKGVEAETLACGTGSVAAAVLLDHMGRLKSPATVRQWSGDDLVVSFNPTPNGANNVTLGGPVETNFTGTLEL
jgi:diaminopimelate epimerase